MTRATVLASLLLLAACGDQAGEPAAPADAARPPPAADDGTCFSRGSCRLLRRADDAPRAYVVERDGMGRISALTLDGMPLADVLRTLDPRQATLVGGELLPEGRFAVIPRTFPIPPDTLFDDLREGIARTWDLAIRHVIRSGTSTVFTCPEIRPPFSRGTTGGSAILATPTQVQFLNVSAAELTEWLGKRTGIVIPVEFPAERLTGVIDRSEEPAVIISHFERAGFEMRQRPVTTRELVVSKP